MSDERQDRFRIKSGLYRARLKRSLIQKGIPKTERKLYGKQL